MNEFNDVLYFELLVSYDFFLQERI